MLSCDLVWRLRDHLLAADYTLDGVLARLGDEGQAGLSRNSTVPAETMLGGQTDTQATLIRLFLLQRQVDRTDVGRALPCEELYASGVLVCDGKFVRAQIDIRPYGFTDAQGEWSGWVASDLMPGLDHNVTPTRPDYVLGVSPASTTLAQITVREQVSRALDLGTGCGVQSLHLSRHTGRLTATDLNPRAISLAKLTAQLNDLDIDFRTGDLYEPVRGEGFDLIATNPPYVMSPPMADEARLVYREGTRLGDGLVEQVVREGARLLNPGGRLQVLANWAETAIPWPERLASWAEGTGCDLWAIERERLDVFDYIELWLTDAGLAGDPRWMPAYAEWIDYFATLGIRSVHLGWITLTRADRENPLVRTESWPHAVVQPIGETIAHQARADDLAALPDDALLLRRLVLDPSVVQETMGVPGAEEPSHVVLRQKIGLGRAVEVDTALGGILGACDGNLALGEIIEAVASILELDAFDVRLSTLPRIREALRDQIVHS